MINTILSRYLLCFRIVKNECHNNIQCQQMRQIQIEVTTTANRRFIEGITKSPWCFDAPITVTQRY